MPVTSERNVFLPRKKLFEHDKLHVRIRKAL